MRLVRLVLTNIVEIAVLLSRAGFALGIGADEEMRFPALNNPVFLLLTNVLVLLLCAGGVAMFLPSWKAPVFLIVSAWWIWAGWKYQGRDRG